MGKQSGILAENRGKSWTAVGEAGPDFPESSLLIRLLFAMMTGMALTKRQREVLDYISGFVSRHSYSPSYEEIASGLGLKSLATVHKHVSNLGAKGALLKGNNRSRSIDILPDAPAPRLMRQAFSPDMGRLPLMGRIVAGLPVEAVQTSESISLADIVGSKDVFALEVRGDSMRDEHIVSGDYVIVERTQSARDGEIVVALVSGAETTLKRFYRQGGTVRLQPANNEMQPILIPAAQVQVQGRVLGVLRRY